MIRTLVWPMEGTTMSNHVWVGGLRWCLCRKTAKVSFSCGAMSCPWHSSPCWGLLESQCDYQSNTITRPNWAWTLLAVGQNRPKWHLGIQRPSYSGLFKRLKLGVHLASEGFWTIAYWVLSKSQFPPLRCTYKKQVTPKKTTKAPSNGEPERAKNERQFN